MHHKHDTDERVPGPFEPDTLLPTQYFDRLRGSHRSGEWMLMIAILEDAVHVYRRDAAAGGRDFEEAEEWIENRDGSYVFSFESICDLASLDADYLRRGLHAFKEAARRRPPSVDTQVTAAFEPEPLRRAMGE
jgi:hypothetical protein